MAILNNQIVMFIAGWIDPSLWPRLHHLRAPATGRAGGGDERQLGEAWSVERGAERLSHGGNIHCSKYPLVNIQQAIENGYL